MGAVGSSSNITSFSASAICSVDFAGKILLVGGINPLLVMVVVVSLDLMV